MNLNWLWIHLLPSLGFIFALILLSHILRERRSPTSTLAWLMGIVFIPYLGVPLYLILGGRKMMRRVEAKPPLPEYPSKRPLDDDHSLQIFDPDNGWFPPVCGHRIQFLPRGEQAFAEISALIKRAKRFVFITTFIIGNDETGKRIVEALAKKASEGVSVCLLLDALGSAKITRRFLAPLQEAGGQVSFFMPMLHLPLRGRANLRNHRKMILVDGDTAVIGGMNLAAEYMGPYESKDRWQDLSLSIEGPVTAHLNEIFRADWNFASKEALPESASIEHVPASTPDGAVQLVASGPDVRNDSLRNALLTAVFRANRRVWIVTPYFVPDELLLEALCIAADRNVEVSIVIPRRSNHRLADLVREGYLTRLQECGADIWLYRPHMLHAKAILVDDSMAVVGSANMDMRSLLLNYEIALFIYDANAIGRVEVWMQGLRTDCTHRKTQPKSAWDVIEGVGRLFAPLL